MTPRLYFVSIFLSALLSLVLQRCSGTVFTSNGYDLRDAFEDHMPQGASTLAFVFDITGSMYDDLVQFIEGAPRIFSTILARRDKAIYNYVLVPFRDPDIGPVTVTTDPDLFQQQLVDLDSYGGGDCPEMSIGAIKLALEVCLPNSHIYVFTDAHAKDYYLLEDVLKLIQRKQSQVIFVKTGDCGSHSHPGYQAYERIASTSSGQIFHLTKADVHEVLNFVRVSLQARKVNLFAVDRHVGDLREFEFDVDGSLREFTISVSGRNPVITVINSRGEVIDQGKGLLDLLNKKNISIVNVKDPTPGRWKLRVNSEGSHTIRATGLSKIDFVYGFSQQPIANLEETYHRPLKGAPTYLLVNATDLPEPATFKTVKIVDFEGKNLQNIPLYRFPGSNMFNATFYPPNEYFFLKVTGADEQGYPIERMTTTAISAQLPAFPVTHITPSVHNFILGSFINLTCSATGYPEPHIRWNWSPVHNNRFISGKSKIINKNLFIYSAEPEDEGKYDCIATNAAGSQDASAFLNYVEVPHVTLPDQELIVKNGEQAILRCISEGIPDPRIKWYKGPVEVQPLSYIQITPDGSLLISDVQETNAGNYTCVAENEAGTTNETMFLNVESKPSLIKFTGVLSVDVLQDISIPCIATGTPNPVIRWLFTNGSAVSTSSKLSVTPKGDLQIKEADPSVSGQYVCQAENKFGRVEQTLELAVTGIKKPILSPLPALHDIPNGGKLSIACIVLDGNPKPSISWYMNGKPIQPGYGLNIVNEKLEITKADVIHEANYSCLVSNMGGNASEETQVNVLSPPKMETTMRSKYSSRKEKHEAFENSPLVLSCPFSGYPLPQLTWLKDGQIVNPKTDPFIAISENGKTLHLKYAKAKHSGKYECVARNDAGESRGKFTVDVMVPPLIRSDSVSNIEVKENEPLLLECEASGNPVPSVLWLKDGNELEFGPEILFSSDNTQLKISNATEHHSGLYVCIASNAVGSSDKEFNVDVLNEDCMVRWRSLRDRFVKERKRYRASGSGMEFTKKTFSNIIISGPGGDSFQDSTSLGEASPSMALNMKLPSDPETRHLPSSKPRKECGDFERALMALARNENARDEVDSFLPFLGSLLRTVEAEERMQTMKEIINLVYNKMEK